MIKGETLEEKRACFDDLQAKAGKCAKILGIVGLVCGAFLMLMLVSENFNLTNLFLGAFLAVALGGGLFICGHAYYFGFITIKEWMENKNVSATDVAGAVGLAAIFSGILGGKKAAKTSLLISVIIIAIVVAIGLYVGLYKYVKMLIEAKKLGFV